MGDKSEEVRGVMLDNFSGLFAVLKKLTATLLEPCCVYFFVLFGFIVAEFVD